MNKIILFAFAITSLAILLACSEDDGTLVTDAVDKGPFSNDANTIISSKDKKFLCDFQWTPGYEEWAYDFDGDKSIGKLGGQSDTLKASWCLIPYGDSTEYNITVKDNTKDHYFCRDINATYSISNESEFIIERGIHDKMICVKLNSDIIKITAGNVVGKQHQDERLYHIVSEKGVYNIAGHLDLLLVKPVHLSVLWEVIVNFGTVNGFISAKLDIPKIKEDWKNYMLKTGYYIDIKTVPIVFPNIMEKMPGNVDDNALTLPHEKDILELPDKMISWYNESAKVINGLGNFFGVDLDVPKLKEVNNVIATTPGYKVKYDVKGDVLSKKENTDSVTCNITNTLNQNIEMIKNIENMPGSYLVDYYSKNNKKLGSGTANAAFLQLTERECADVSYSIGVNNGKNAQAFGVKKGYVLSHDKFFESKNAGRLLAALLYSKILGVKYPVNNEDGRYLSTYYDDAEVEQPSRFWKTREEGSDKNQQLEQNILPEIAFKRNLTDYGQNIFYIHLQ